MKRKILTIGMMAMTMVLSGNVEAYANENVATVAQISTEAESAAECWDGVSIEMPSEVVNIDGAYYYKIYNGAQLAYVAQTGGDWLNYNYILANDIVLNSTEITWDENGTLTVDAASLNKWVPIGELKGNFEGAGHTVSGIYIETGDKCNGGLITSVAGTVANITVKNSYIASYYSAGGVVTSCNTIENCSFEGYVYSLQEGIGSVVGGVVGAADTVKNCVNYGEVSGKKSIIGGIAGNCYNIYDCTNYGNVTAVGGEAGGIVGKSSNRVLGTYTISNCVNNGIISAGYGNAGGIVGEAHSTNIINCINNGDVSANGKHMGGIVGTNGIHPIIENCINNGKISSGEGNVAGIIGTGGMDTYSINNCINYGEISGQGDYVGGIAAYHRYASAIDNCTNYANVTSTGNYVGGIIGYTEDVHDNLASSIKNSCNIGTVTGNTYVGGITGYMKSSAIEQCYNVGNVVGEALTGAVIGHTNHLFEEGKVSVCYYLKSDTVNAGINAFGNLGADELGVAESKDPSFFPVCIKAEANPAYMYLGNADILFFVDRMYTIVLNRAADEVGTSTWFTMLKTGAHDGASIAKEFVLGAEFELRNLSDSDYIDVLYQTFFDRPADASGKELWMYHLEAGFSRDYVLSKFVNSDEFTLVCDSYGIARGVMNEDGTVINAGIPAFVNRLYGKVLGRNADSDGLSLWVYTLATRAQSAEAVATNFFGSSEYDLKKTDNATYIKDLYSVFMDREADTDGLAYWEFVLSQGFTREYVLSEFAKSEEFKAIAMSYGLE